MEDERLTQADRHAVVIGAGIGGLSAALRLATQGLQVTVVEAADGPGGKMRTAPSEVGPIDIGPTVLTMKSVFEDLFAEAGSRLEDHVTLHRDAVLARHFWPDGSTLDLFDDPTTSAEAIAAFAGHEARRQFERFSQSAARLFEAFDTPIMKAPRPKLAPLMGHVLSNPRLIPAMMPGLSLARRLAMGFSDRRLQQLFGRYATYVGGSPYQSPAVLSLIWQSEARGVWAVEGGMNCLAQAMHDLAVAQGVSFVFSRSVTEITRQDGRASGVQLSDGTQKHADCVVFNGDPRALRMGLLGQAPSEAVATTGTEPRSLSAFVWGFAAEARGVELSHHNVFFCADPRAEFGDIARGQMPQQATLYVCAQDRGAGVPSGPERFEIIMNGPPGHRTTPEERETCQARTFEALGRMGLTFSPVPPVSALTTPMDFDRAFPASGGSLYGMSPHGMMATFRRPTARTKLPGLYLAGGGAHPGAGIPMACLSGKHAAEAIATDLALPSTSRLTATPGGTSTGSVTMANGRSPSSVS